MNLKKLEAFVAVLEKKSFSDAAAALKTSQPAISLKIKSLEEELGFELLDRGLSGIQPTPAGTLVHKASKEILHNWRRLEDDLHNIQGTLTGTLTIGASTIPGTYLVPRWIKSFRERYPNVDVTIEIGDSKKILSMLLDHQVDIGIVGLHHSSNKISFNPIASDSLVWIAANDHSGEIDFSDLHTQDFILREEGSGTRKAMVEYLASHGYTLTHLPTSLSIGSTEAVIAAVEAGLGVSFVSKLAALPAAKANRIKLIEPVKPVDRNFYCTTLLEDGNRPIIQEFTNLLFKQ
jgi:DNA-binding transcriptional LysR family regulator